MFRVYYEIVSREYDNDNNIHNYLFSNGYLESDIYAELLEKIKDLSYNNNDDYVYVGGFVHAGDRCVNFATEILEIVEKIEFDYRNSYIFEIQKKEVKKRIEDDAKKRIENETKEKEDSKIRELKNLEERVKQLKEELSQH